MSAESSESSSPQEASFDHDAISIDATEIQPNSFKVEFEVPPEQVARFIRQLRMVKPDIKPQETASLLISVCLEESNARLDRERFFDPVMAEGSDPPVLHPEKPFRGTFIQDGFAMPTWPDFSLLTLSLPDLEVTDELVEQELHDQRFDAGTRADLTDSIAPMDEIVAKVSIRMSGHDQPIMEMSELTARVPDSGQKMNLGGVLLDGGDALLGRTAGSTTTFASRFPDNLFDTRLRGRDIDVEVQVTSARRITPATAEEVAERFGTPNVDVLMMQIRFALEHRMTEQKRSEASNQLMPQLRDLCPIDIPEQVIDQMTARNMPMIIDQARKDGMDEDALRKHAEEQKPLVENEAKRRAVQLVLTRLMAKHLEINASEDELLEEIRNEAAKRNRRPEDLRKELIDADNMGFIGDRVRELKIVDKLASMATPL